MSLVARIALSALTRAERHRYGTHPSQIADLHLPSGDGPFPAAVVLHGGFWQTRYGKLVTRPLARDLARRGWAAWNLEYRRLGDGRGGGGGWPMTFDDVAAGIDHLAPALDGRVDRSRVVAVGHSAGGQLALWAAGRAKAAVRVTEVIALAPVTNLARAGASARVLLGGTVDEVPERYAEADPVRRAPPDVPVVIVHARDDETIPIERSREYAATARAAGARIELVELAAGGHRAVIDPSSAGWRATIGRFSSRAGS